VGRDVWGNVLVCKATAAGDVVHDVLPEDVTFVERIVAAQVVDYDMRGRQSP
jgi:hypothetical protein